MNTYTIGQRVTWLHEPRGGYGYTVPVDGVVTALRAWTKAAGQTHPAAKRVQIEVCKENGETVRRWVTPDRLRAR